MAMFRHIQHNMYSKFGHNTKCCTHAHVHTKCCMHAHIHTKCCMHAHIHTKCCTHVHIHTQFRFCIWHFFHVFKADTWIEKLSSWRQYSKQRALDKLTVKMLGCAYGERFKTDHRKEWLTINHLLPFCHILFLHSKLFLQPHNNLHTAVLYGKIWIGSCRSS